MTHFLKKNLNISSDLWASPNVTPTTETRHLNSCYLLRSFVRSLPVNDARSKGHGRPPRPQQIWPQPSPARR